MIKINLGSGRLTIGDFVNIDKVQIIDNKSNVLVDHVIDLEVQPIPYGDDEVEEIRADNIFEHLDNFIFSLNECHRVLKEGGILCGVVPMAGTDADFGDPTHKRHFTMKTFSYLTGVSLALSGRPKRPKYADYGIKPWIKKSVDLEGDLIKFILTPRKRIWQ